MSRLDTVLTAINPWWPLIKLALVLLLFAGLYIKGRSDGYDVRVSEENREEVATQLALNKFNVMWDEKSAKAASVRSTEVFDYNVISKEISNDLAEELRLKPFNVNCNWSPRLLDLRNEAIRQSNSAASGLPRTVNSVPTTSDH